MDDSNIKESLTFKIDDGDETSIPTAVFNGALSFAEIGAVLFMIAVGEGKLDLAHPRMDDAPSVETIKSLIERKFVEVTAAKTPDGTKITISIDLNKIIPSDPGEEKDAAE